MKRLIVFSVAFVFLESSLLTPALAQEAGSSRPPPLITIDLTPSRARVEAGAGLGVVGTITNVSDTTVYVRENDIAISLPVELEGSEGRSFGYYAFFPTEQHYDSLPYEERLSHVLMLQPGDSYGVVWTPGPQQGLGSPAIFKSIWAQRQFLLFAPGDYAITLSAKYWLDPTLPDSSYRTLTKNATVSVAAPESIIVFAAGLGGLIGYVIFPGKRRKTIRLRRRRRNAGLLMKGAGESASIVGAVLLSVIVTILLARLGDTQFVIQVTIRDFWGAVAIGFVAFYGGTAGLDRIVSRGADNGGDGDGDGDADSGEDSEGDANAAGDS
jgi:hypothetical protein